MLCSPFSRDFKCPDPLYWKQREVVLGTAKHWEDEKGRDELGPNHPREAQT